MNRLFAFTAFVLSLLCPFPAGAAGGDEPGSPAVGTMSPAETGAAAGYFVRPASFAAAVILPAPPEAGSLAAQADLEAVLQVQASRGAADIAWAKRIEKDNVFNNAEVLGAWFAAKNLPYTAEFFEQVGSDIHAVGEQVKLLYRRPRPPATDPRVHPCVAVPKSYSYPSGHSLQAEVWGELLAAVFPEKRAELLARAHRAAWGRIIGGVHFPTDDIGGRLVGDALAKELLLKPEIRAGLARVRAEAQPFLELKAKAA